MVHNEIDRHKWFDHLWIRSEASGSGAHCGKIDEQWHPGEILQNDASDNKGNFGGAFGLCLPVCEIADILFRDAFAIAIAENRFEDNSDRNRELGDGANARFFKGWQGIKRGGFSQPGLELLA
jgi:hypothetical protein